MVDKTFLLWDSVRVLTRILTKAKEHFPWSGVLFHDHTRRAKCRMIGIQYDKNKKRRKKKYLDLLKVIRKALSYAQNTTGIIEHNPRLVAMAICNELNH